MATLSRMRASDAFDGLGSEREQDSRNVEIKNKKLEWLLRGFSWVFEEWKENEQGGRIYHKNKLVYDGGERK